MRLSLIILLFLTSCNFRPSYERPCMEIPAAWRFAADPSEEDWINIRWWEQFEDPVLDDLIEMALINNQDLQLATCRVMTYYSQFRILSSLLFPQVEGTASFLREGLTENLNYSPLIPGTRYNGLYNLSLGLSYEIDFWAKIRNTSEASYCLFLGAIENRRTVILTLISSLASAYVRLREFDRQLALSRETYASRKEAWRLINLRFEIGLVSEMDVEQAESQTEIAEVQVKRYEEIIPQQENLICTLLGVPPNNICRGKTLEELRVTPSVPAGLPADLLENRPDIVQAEYGIMATYAEIGVARAAFFPSISLTTLFGYESTSLHNLLMHGSQAWDWGPSFTQPLFTGWRLTYQLEEAKARACEAIHTYQQTILTAFQEVSDALIGHQKAREIVEVQKRLVNSLSIYLHLSILRYDNGENDYLTVLNAETSLFNAQLELERAESFVLITLIDLYKALGGGWVIDADDNLTPHLPPKPMENLLFS